MSIPVELEPLPDTYTWGKVVGRVIHGVADTAEDSDDKPQARAAAGKVHFDPKNTLTKTPAGADYTALVIQGRETANLSSSGRVLDAEGRQGIWLIAGVWSVSFELETPGAKIKGFDIEVTASHTDEAPLDLATVAPYTAPGALTVKTMLIPTGGTDGQVLTLDGASGTLVWADNGSGVASWAEIEALPDAPDLVIDTDSRLADQRVPTDGSVTPAKLNATLAASIAKADASLNQVQVDARAQLLIDALVAGSPGLLNTLDELAAALGDDPNFSTTVLAQIAAKADGAATTAALATKGVKTETEAVVIKNEGTGTWGARPTGYLRVRWYGTDPGPGAAMVAGDIREIPVT